AAAAAPLPEPRRPMGVLSRASADLGPHLRHPPSGNSEGLGKAMCLHDSRRAGATFLATVAPDQVGLIPGILQHASPEVSEKHYNLARSVEASRRFGAHLAQTRGMLRSRIACKEG